MKRAYLFALALALMLSTGCMDAPNEAPAPEVPEGPDTPEAVELVPPDETTNGPLEPSTALRYDPEELLALEQPPDLVVSFGGSEELEAVTCGFNWVVAMSGGERAVLCADAPHPLELVGMLTAHETESAQAEPVFLYLPDGWSVRAWEDTCTPECDGLHQEIVKDGSWFELLPGGHIYEIVASWGDGESFGGSARYAFHVVAPEE